MRLFQKNLVNGSSFVIFTLHLTLVRWSNQGWPLCCWQVSMKDIRNALRTAVQNLEGMREGWYAQHDTKMDNNTLIMAVTLVPMISFSRCQQLYQNNLDFKNHLAVSNLRHSEVIPHQANHCIYFVCEASMYRTDHMLCLICAALQARSIALTAGYTC